MKIGTEQEWQAARKKLLAAERELEKHAERVTMQRRELPWVPVEKEYSLATADGPKSFQDLFEGRSQLWVGDRAALRNVRTRHLRCARLERWPAPSTACNHADREQRSCSHIVLASPLEHRGDAVRLA